MLTICTLDVIEKAATLKISLTTSISTLKRAKQPEEVIQTPVKSLKETKDVKDPKA